MRIKQILKAPHFLLSIYKWIRGGKKTRSLQMVRFLYDNVCKPCEHFDNDMCDICWCNIKRDTLKMNKLALSTEQCPLTPPKWGGDSRPANNSEPVFLKDSSGSKRTKRVGCRGCGKKINKKGG